MLQVRAGHIRCWRRGAAGLALIVSPNISIELQPYPGWFRTLAPRYWRGKLRPWEV